MIGADEQGEQHREHRDDRVAGGDLVEHRVPARRRRHVGARLRGAAGPPAPAAAAPRAQTAPGSSIATSASSSGRSGPGRAGGVGLLGVAHAAAPSAGCSPAIIRPSTSRGVSPGTMPTMRPRYMTMIRSARATTSSSSVETTTHGDARVARLDDALVDELDRADVDAAGRLRGDEQAQVAAELAGEHDLLLVAAREPADLASRCPACGRRTPSPSRGRSRRVRRAGCCRARTNGGAAAAVEHEVLGDRELADQAVFRAVLGHEPDAGVEDAPDARGGQLDAVEADASPARAAAGRGAPR